jgi:hypothetical protein
MLNCFKSLKDLSKLKKKHLSCSLPLNPFYSGTKSKSASYLEAYRYAIVIVASFLCMGNCRTCNGLQEACACIVDLKMERDTLAGAKNSAQRIRYLEKVKKTSNEYLERIRVRQHCVLSGTNTLVLMSFLWPMFRCSKLNSLLEKLRRAVAARLFLRRSKWTRWLFVGLLSMFVPCEHSYALCTLSFI